jgi:alanyl-tRNA synthetase
MQWTCAKIRETFLNYFEQQGHAVVRSSPLVPANDNTLLFTNAGMVQFKDLFLGLETRSYVRAASSQRCVRAGGKHNDLENVGYTARHHTFFEMLGNFSFGDYFKRDAIRFAWEFLTGVIGLPPEKLWVTVFEEDDEAADIWLKEIGADPARFSRIGAKDNFWAMGDTGPCGPCSEIFYDHGEAIPGGPPGTPEEDGDRYIEIWNLVFMQFNRSEDGTLTPLPKPSVDTGMGLERLAAILQGVHSNYEIDLFQALIAEAGRLTGAHSHESKSLRVIADHIRASAFLVADGVYPSNVGRGFVLRRIVRRAIRHGYMLGMRQPFFFKLVATLCEQMGEAFPELVQKQALVERILRQEEERFGETIDQGMRMLEQALAEGDGAHLNGETLFKLYDTYGFPVDLTADIARERDITLDRKGFEVYMNRQRDLSRQRSGDQFKRQQSGLPGFETGTEFRGYDVHRCEGQIEVLLDAQNELTETLEAGARGGVVLDQTPFYAESGGQVGDRGTVYGPNGALFVVEDTRKLPGDAILHLGYLQAGALKGGDAVEAHIDEVRRQSIRMNHTATHLLHAALRHILGDHVAQKGSKVDAQHLRFDFSHFEPVTDEQIRQVEKLVNEQIRMNHVAETRVMKFDDAIKSGAMALFDEKYGDEVRVLRLGEFSTELCGGTHVEKSGDIGLFKVSQESGIASGVRRIEAVTGEEALEWVWKQEDQLAEVARLLKSDRDSVVERVRVQQDKLRINEKELERLAAQLASHQGSGLVDQAAQVEGIHVLVTRVDNPDVKAMRELMDQLKNKLGSAVVALGAVDGQKVTLLVGVTDDQSKRLNAGALIGQIAPHIGGRGGGKPTLAQAGGTDPAGLDKALQQLEQLVRDQLA